MNTLWSHAEEVRAPVSCSTDPVEAPEATEIQDSAATAQPNRRPLIRLDAGWLFLAAGVMAIGATVLIPAQRDLALARWQRDRATAIERHREERLSHYGAYLAAIEKGDESVVLSLAGTQLNKSPSDRVPLLPAPDPSRASASIFPALEPEPLRLVESPDFASRASLLERWTTDDQVRLWLLAGGVLALLMGVLPPSSRR